MSPISSNWDSNELCRTSRRDCTGYCLRCTDRRNGAVVALSGDTGPHPDLPQLARGADLLIHEACLRPDLPDDALRGNHSRSVDAARIAAEAGVGRLLLVHLSGGHEQQSLAAARTIFPKTELAREGEELFLPE